jgi:long-chain acyl-CoA synthetase
LVTSSEQQREGSGVMDDYAKRPWLKQYRRDMGHAFEPPHHGGLHHTLAEAARRHPGRTALVAQVPLSLPLLRRPVAAMAYGELDELSDRFAAALAAQGVAPGEPVALLGMGSIQYVVALFGTFKAGAVALPLGPELTAEEVRGRIADSGARVAFVLTQSYARLNSIRCKTGLRRAIVSHIKDFFPRSGQWMFSLAQRRNADHDGHALYPGDLWLKDALIGEVPGAEAGVEPRVQPRVERGEAALMQYVERGPKAKAVRLSHRALVASAAQLCDWLGPEGRSDPIRVLAATPLTHVFGVVGALACTLGWGGTLGLTANPADPSEAIASLRRFRPTLVLGVPSLYDALAQHPSLAEGGGLLEPVATWMSGAASLNPRTSARFEAVTGRTVVEGYGLCEAAFLTHCMPLGAERRRGCIGVPLPGTECRVVSPEDGRTPVPAGEVGELVLRSPALMEGYHRRPEETRKVLKDGWLYTRDLVRMDAEGFFHLVARSGDVVRLPQATVYPRRVEQVLTAHEGVAEAVVVGIQLRGQGKASGLKAWVVPSAGRRPRAEDLREHCRRHLPPHEVPDQFAFVKGLPKTVFGRVMRQELTRLVNDPPDHAA